MKITSGSDVLDALLDGGYSTGMLNTIYGPAASGKTTCCLLATIACYKSGKKTVFIDTENGFSVERLRQLTPDFKDVLDFVILLKANSFSEQKKKFEFLKKLLPNPRIGLICVDTIGAQYRVARKKDVKTINQELAEQIDVLRGIYRNSNTLVLITDQVYADLENKNKEGFKLVGGEIIRNQSRNIIQLQNLNKNKRMAILEKAPELEEARETIFEIRENGFYKV
ncbi:hypothetical protein A3K72_02570 [Candidatus Woesearchaeota archaeon RBG_13_36_6]|nr:MAG: hypothetical protein A3K72_02570 [Candidatus Woesearchaeota archaeon RBG_13_36_6]